VIILNANPYEKPGAGSGKQGARSEKQGARSEKQGARSEKREARNVFASCSLLPASLCSYALLSTMEPVDAMFDWELHIWSRDWTRAGLSANVPVFVRFFNVCIEEARVASV
jgi:hypothetical protein